MKIQSQFQVFGLGQAALDIIGKVEVYPPPDVKCELSDVVIQGGGPVATALVALARWGLSCYFAGVLGDDLFGQLIETSLRKEGIDPDGIVIRKGFSSQFAFILCEPGIGRRTIFWQRPTGAPIRPAELNLTILKQVKIFHTDGLMMESSLFTAKAARQAGVAISVDAGTLREGMLDLARLSDFFIASETFSRQLTGGDDHLETCQRLISLGPRVAGVTLGEKGYIALAKGKVIQKTAYPVQVVDTTGCGDVFHAGFIYGFIQGWDVEKSLDFAAWAAAMVSTKMGGRAGIPSLHDLRTRGY